MKITKLDSFPAKSNPFDHDHYRMGTYVGVNVVIMYEKFEHEFHEYLVVVDRTTGERIKIELAKQDLS